MRSSVHPYSPIYQYPAGRSYLKTLDTPSLSPFSERELREFEARQGTHEATTETPLLRRDYLGQFIPYTEQQALNKAGVPKEKQNDLFIEHAVNTQSAAFCYLTLSTTKKVAKAPKKNPSQKIEKNTSSASALVVIPKDPNLKLFKQMHDRLNSLLIKTIRNGHNLSLGSRERDFALYQQAKRNLDYAYRAYLAEKAQQNNLSDEASRQAFAEGRASTYKHQLSTDRVTEIPEDHASEQGETSESMAASSVPNAASDHEQISLITFNEAVENLKKFADEEINEKIKLDLPPKNDPFKEAYDVARKIGAPGLSIRIAMAAAGASLAAWVGGVFFALKWWAAAKERKLEMENAFRKALQEDLKHILKLVSEVNMPTGVNSSGQNTATQNQYSVVDPNLAYVTGEVAGSLQNQADAFVELTTTIKQTQTQNEERIARLERQAKAAERLLGLNNGSTDSLASIPENLRVGQPASLATSPIAHSFSPAEVRSASRSPSPEFERLEKAFAEVSEKNDALQQEVSGLKIALNQVNAQLEESKAGQQQIIALLLAQQQKTN